MSDKFGVELILGSGLTTLVHLARQATCAQFGAEDTLRLPLRVTLVPFFDMPERGLRRLEDDIAEVISGMPDKALSFWVSQSDMVVNSATGSVLMKLGLHGENVFSVLEKSPPKQKKRSLFGFGRSREDEADTEPPVHPMMALQREIWETVSRAPGSRIFNRDFEFLPHLPIIHRSGLSKSDLADAAEYAARSNQQPGSYERYKPVADMACTLLVRIGEGRLARREVVVGRHLAYRAELSADHRLGLSATAQRGILGFSLFCPTCVPLRCLTCYNRRR